MSSPFLHNLKLSRLLSEEQHSAVARLAEEVPEEDLPAALVADGVLTAFQAKRVEKGDVRGLVLGPYHVLEEVGRGGMGRVYKALHTVMGRVVALKVMAPELVESEQSRSWFLREVRSVTRLSHPNIVLAYDANELDGVLFLALEFVEGTTLDALVRSEGPLPIARACELMRQSALGLQHAYQKGLVHRDIKPANLLLPRVERSELPTCPLLEPAGPPQPPVLVKIADFGLARLHGLHSGDTVARNTCAGFLGTPDYVAPEQSRDSRCADIRSDLYSLGCTLHFTLTGRAPFGGDTVMEKLLKHATEPPPPVEVLRPDVPPGVAKLVARLLAKDPDQRFQTPAEVALALAPWCEGAGSVSGRNPVDEGRPTPDLVGALAPTPVTPPPAIRSAPTPIPAAVPTGPAALTWDSDPEVAVPALTPTLLVPDGGAAQPHQPAAPSAAADKSLLGAALLAPEGRVTCEQPRGSPATPPPQLLAPPLAASPRVEGAARQKGNVSLHRAWARWLGVVEELVRHPGLLPCREAEYQVLYRDLLACCAAHAEQAGPKERALFRHLEGLVRPWLALEALARTEAPLLEDLAWRVRSVGRALGLKPASRTWCFWVAALAIVALGPLLTVLAEKTAQQLPRGPVGEWLEMVGDGVRSVRGVLGPTGWWLAFLGAAGAFLVLPLLRRRA